MTSIMVVTPLGAPDRAEEAEDHWLHRPRLEDRSESALSRSEPGTPGGHMRPPEVTGAHSVSVPTSPRSLIDGFDLN